MEIKDILNNLDLQLPKEKVEFSLAGEYDATITISETYSVYLLAITDKNHGTSCATARFGLYRGEDLEDEQTTFHSSYCITMPKLASSSNKEDFKRSKAMLKAERYIQDVCMEFSGFFHDNDKQVDATFMKMHVIPFREGVVRRREEQVAKEAETAALKKLYKRIELKEAEKHFNEILKECHDVGESAPREFIVFSKEEMMTKTLRMKVIESEDGSKIEWQNLDKDKNWCPITLNRATKIVERSHTLV